MDVLVKALAVIGVVAILGFGLWGTVQVARAVPNAFSALASAISGITSVFVPAEEELVFSIERDTFESGEPFTLSFVHRGKDEDRQGTYHFAYSCQEGFSFEVPSDSGSFSIAACETPLSLGENTSVRLIPVSEDNRFTSVAIGVRFVPETDGADERILADTAHLTIVNEDEPRSDDTIDDNITGGGTAARAALILAILRGDRVDDDDDGNQGTGTTTPPSTGGGSGRTPTVGPRTDRVIPISNGSRPSNPLGHVDFAARIIAVGLVDSQNNFVATSTVRTNERAAVQFEVENVGTRTSGNWTFNAVLPTAPIHIFSSDPQQALAPGDKIIYTVGFDRTKAGENVEFTVNVDPARRIGEISETNNIAKATLRIIKE